MRALQLRDHPHRDGLAWVVDHGDYGTILPTSPDAPVTEALADATQWGDRIVWDGRDVATCGECGRRWDDAIVSSVTPSPAGRCPFEYDHDKEVAHS